MVTFDRPVIPRFQRQLPTSVLVVGVISVFVAAIFAIFAVAYDCNPYTLFGFGMTGMIGSTTLLVGVGFAVWKRSMIHLPPSFRDPTPPPTSPDDSQTGMISTLDHLFVYTTGRVLTLQHKRKIGAGGFGEVHELYNISTRQSFVRKLVHQTWSTDVENEIRAVTKLCGQGTHKHIVEVLDTGKLDNSPYLFIDMELCDLNLKHCIYRQEASHSLSSTLYFVRDAPQFTKMQLIWNIMEQISSGLEYIHTHKEVHRDLKPENSILSFFIVLINFVLYSCKSSVWKLADFGFTSEATSKTPQSSKFARGTSCYRAPELLQDGSACFTNKLDIWSLGCILYELSTSKKAFSGDMAVAVYQIDPAGFYEALDLDLDKAFDDDCKNSIRRNILQMLNSTYRARPSATELLRVFRRSPLHNIHLLRNTRPGEERKLTITWNNTTPDTNFFLDITFPFIEISEKNNLYYETMAIYNKRATIYNLDDLILVMNLTCREHCQHAGFRWYVHFYIGDSKYPFDLHDNGDKDDLDLYVNRIHTHIVHEWIRFEGPPGVERHGITRKL